MTFKFFSSLESKDVPTLFDFEFSSGCCLLRWDHMLLFMSFI